jgi:hypothetical protein
VLKTIGMKKKFAFWASVCKVLIKREFIFFIDAPVDYHRWLSGPMADY